MPKCERCGSEEKLYPFWEWMVCYACRAILRENERINEHDKVLEERKLR